MATRKKKTEKELINEISTLVAEVTLQATDFDWPKITKDSHLTVYTYEDGRTKLEWDDEALLRDVQNAILKAESTIPAKTKTTKTKKVKE